MRKFYFDETDIQYRLILSKGRGILDPKIIDAFLSIFRESYFTFSKDLINMKDAEQDCLAHFLNPKTWMSWEKLKGNTLVFFTEIIKREIHRSNYAMKGGWRRGNEKSLPIFISFSSLFNDDE